MIAVERLNEQEPTVLRKLFRDGMTELDRARVEFEDYQVTVADMREQGMVGPDGTAQKLPRFSFEFKRYREREVRQVLETMFHGKCAYCEQRYGALHPMDVEHWRPKALVQHGGAQGTKQTGYWWLAADWHNLLPSCIDCNRGRKHQIDIDSGERVLMGKGNQFPLVEGSASAIDNDDETLVGEEPLLLNPCDRDFDPVEHFSYEDGIMIGLTDRAKASIRVYALNRPELVHERQAMVRVFEHRLNVLTDIAELVAEARQSGDASRLDRERTLVEQMHDRVRDELFAMRNAERPFAGMIRHLLRTVAHDLEQ